MKNNTFLSGFLSFAILTVVFLTIYAAFQQTIRQSANDPQIQIAGDMVALISSGADIAGIEAQIGTLRKVDVNLSLSPFVGIYDKDGKPLATSGYLDGQQIVPPAGVFAAAAKAGDDHLVTLEPKKGVRIASAIRSFDGGFVVSGKSLTEAENRIRHLALMVFIAWIISLAGLILKALVCRNRQNS